MGFSPISTTITQNIQLQQYSVAQAITAGTPVTLITADTGETIRVYGVLIHPFQVTAGQVLHLKDGSTLINYLTCPSNILYIHQWGGTPIVLTQDENLVVDIQSSSGTFQITVIYDIVG